MLTIASLFSGIGLLDLGLHRAGMNTAIMCEANKAARNVIARRFPGIPVHPDVRELTTNDLHEAGCRPDTTVLAAGFPCQDLSTAGSRRGMGRGTGTRSALFWDVDRLLDEFRPRWVVLENVPGLLSSRGGRDMGAVLGALADRGYGFAWRVLDAQNFGVPQRRRRVIIVGHLGIPWSAPAQVLFEPPGGGWDIAQVGEAGQGATADARGRAAWTGGQLTFQKVIRSRARSADGSLPPEVWERRDVSATLSPFDFGSPSRAADVVVGALTASQGGPDDNDERAGRPVVCATGDHTHALTANGCDSSEDGTGRGTPIVAFDPDAGQASSGAFEVGPGITPTLRGARPHALAFHLTQDPISGPVVPALGAKSGGNGVLTTTRVRRLTPLECERLQGAPAGWTEGQSDSARYRQLGNAVAVPVFEWVGQRLVAVDTATRQSEAS